MHVPFDLYLLLSMLPFCYEPLQFVYLIRTLMILIDPYQKSTTAAIFSIAVDVRTFDLDEREFAARAPKFRLCLVELQLRKTFFPSRLLQFWIFPRVYATCFFAYNLLLIYPSLWVKKWKHFYSLINYYYLGNYLLNNSFFNILCVHFKRISYHSI